MMLCCGSGSHCNRGHFPGPSGAVLFCVLSVTSLFEMAPKHSALMLPRVPGYKEAATCFTEKIVCAG